MNVQEAHRIGRVSFMGLELLVEPGTLVPRPETELLCTTAIEAVRNLGLDEVRIVDMCCGAGNLACAIGHHVREARVWASDMSSSCADLALRNIALHHLEKRVSVHQGDLFGAFSGLELENSIDVLVCNPPYISEKKLDGESAELLAWEPREAFAAGPYGLTMHSRVVKEALAFLRPGGLLLLEVGAGQDRQVKTLFERARGYEDVRSVPDAQGQPRVVFARRSHAAT